MIKLTPEIIERVEAECLMMLAAERDCYQTWLEIGRIKRLPDSGWFVDAQNTAGYAAEAYGIMRGLVGLGYCYFDVPDSGAMVRENATWWLQDLQRQVLDKELELASDPRASFRHYRNCFSSEHVPSDTANREVLKRFCKRRERQLGAKP